MGFLSDLTDRLKEATFTNYPGSENLYDKYLGDGANPPPPPPPPTVTPPKPIPLPNSQEVRAAQRRALEAQRRRRGRLSTILSAPQLLTVNLDDPLGGG